MIEETSGFRLNGGAGDYTKRDYPFPESSSTPFDTIDLSELLGDPTDPDYLKKNIVAHEDNSIKVPINQPGIPINEFAERLIALEQENVVLREELEQLKKVVSITLSFAEHTFPLLSQYYGHRIPTDEAAKKVRDGLWDWAKDHGVEFIPFEITCDGVIVIRDGKEIPECSLKSTDEPSPANGAS